MIITITQYTNTDSFITRMVLRRNTLSMRDEFRNVIQDRLNQNNIRLYGVVMH